MITRILKAKTKILDKTIGKSKFSQLGFERSAPKIRLQNWSKKGFCLRTKTNRYSYRNNLRRNAEGEFTEFNLLCWSRCVSRVLVDLGYFQANTGSVLLLITMLYWVFFSQLVVIRSTVGIRLIAFTTILQLCIV